MCPRDEPRIPFVQYFSLDYLDPAKFCPQESSKRFSSQVIQVAILVISFVSNLIERPRQ